MRILPSVGFEPTTFCIRGKRLTARPRGTHGRKRTTPMLICIKTPWKYFSTKKPTRYHLAFNISCGVVRSLPWSPRGLAVRRLLQMQKVVGSNLIEGKIRFSQFTLFNRVECEKLFCKTNIKLKVLKLNKTYLKLFEMFELF